MAAANWQRGLERLHRLFERAGEHYAEQNEGRSLELVLFQAGPGYHDRLADDEIRNVLDPVEDFVQAGVSHYLRARSPVDATIRCHAFVGTSAGLTRFRKLSIEAARVLRSVPSERLTSIPRETLSEGLKEFRWWWFLFDVAWQQTPPRAEKKVWDSTATFPYSTSRLQGVIRLMGGSAILKQWAEQLPDFFCSKIDDAFAASCDAIDFLLSDSDSGSKSTGKDDPAESCYATLNDPIPDRYCRGEGRNRHPIGPLEGNQTELAWAVAGRPGRKPRTRHLKDMHNKQVWVQRDGKKLNCSVYFRSLPALHSAEQRLDEFQADRDCWDTKKS